MWRPYARGVSVAWLNGGAAAPPPPPPPPSAARAKWGAKARGFGHITGPAPPPLDGGTTPPPPPPPPTSSGPGFAPERKRKRRAISPDVDQYWPWFIDTLTKLAASGVLDE